jgi:molybdenum cofactor cytidylyltransferase
MKTQIDPGTPKIATLLLAAGESARFGGRKQLASIHGSPMILHALDALGATPPTDTFVVLGAFGDEIALLIKDRATLIVNDDWATGMGSSIACGIREISASGSYDGVLIALCDQINLTREDYAKLTAAFTGKGTVATRHADGYGVPAIFPASAFGDLERLSGPVGARKIINAQQSAITGIDLPNALLDIDTQGDLKQVDLQSA